VPLLGLILISCRFQSHSFDSGPRYLLFLALFHSRNLLHPQPPLWSHLRLSPLWIKASRLQRTLHPTRYRRSRLIMETWLHINVSSAPPFITSSWHNPDLPKPCRFSTPTSRLLFKDVVCSFFHLITPLLFPSNTPWTTHKLLVLPLPSASPPSSFLSV
jgi:hypothetical protein